MPLKSIEKDQIKIINQKLDILLEAITSVKVQLKSRDTVTGLLNYHLANIVNSLKYLNEIHVKESIKNRIINLNNRMEAIIIEIQEDFIKNKINDWMMELVKHSLSPLSIPEMNNITHPYEDISDEKEKSALVIQRTWRSRVRYQQHLNIFGNPLIESNGFTKFLAKNNISNINETRLKKIYYSLIGHAAIIDKKVYHWTTWDNLRNIIKYNAFFGNKTLTDQSIKFTKNALGKLDILNGDGNIICFCPYFVDPIVAEGDNNHSIRQNLIRLTINLNQLDKTISSYQYNQFFKLFDLCCPPFISKVKITNCFSAQIERSASPQLIISFIYNNEIYQTTIEASEAIFYGNLHTINKFCLDKLFELIDKAINIKSDSNPHFSAQFYDYLLQQNDNEIRKILISLCQRMTIFSEYNFNCALTLTNYLIDEIYDVNTTSLIKLSNLSLNEYKHFTDCIIKANEPPINQVPNHCITLINNHQNLSGSNFSISNITNDLTTLPSQFFADNKYIETRNGCPNFHFEHEIQLKI